LSRRNYTKTRLTTKASWHSWARGSRELNCPSLEKKFHGNYDRLAHYRQTAFSAKHCKQHKKGKNIFEGPIKILGTRVFKDGQKQETQMKAL